MTNRVFFLKILEQLFYYFSFLFTFLYKFSKEKTAFVGTYMSKDKHAVEDESNNRFTSAQDLKNLI